MTLVVLHNTIALISLAVKIWIIISYHWMMISFSNTWKDALIKKGNLESF